MNKSEDQTMLSDIRGTAERVLSVVDQGLVNGIGQREPGRMCVEAAVCYAMGLPHSDNPPCVMPVLRDLKITLNDRDWGTCKARAAGLRRVAIAQLGTENMDQFTFARKLTFKVWHALLKKDLINIVPEQGHRDILGDLFSSEQQSEIERSLGVARTIAAAQEYTSTSRAILLRFSDAASVHFTPGGIVGSVEHILRLSTYLPEAQEIKDRTRTQLAELIIEVLREMGAPAIGIMDELAPKEAEVGMNNEGAD